MKLSKAKQEHYIKTFLNSKIFTIYQAYKKPSQDKINSYNKLVYQYENDNNYRLFNFKILGHNSAYYTIGFYVYNFKSHNYQLIIKTYLNTYVIDL